MGFHLENRTDVFYEKYDNGSVPDCVYANRALDGGGGGGGAGGPVHITISGPSPETGKPNALLPLPLEGGGGGGGDSSASNVSITITDASPDGACGARPLPAGGFAAAHSKRLAFRRSSEAKIVQHKALVHRTSEGSPYRS